jgi:hypothetical protein
MTALTRSLTPNEIKGKLYRLPVAGLVKIFGGAVVVLNSDGYAEPATTGTSLRPIGIAEPTGIVDNTEGDDGDLYVEVRSGIWGLQNSAGGDEITVTDIGATVYLVDDQTVAKTTGGGTRSAAGAVRMIEGSLVYVELGIPGTLNGGLLPANNLSDVANAATARANLGANKVALTCKAANLVGADAKVYWVVSPVAGTLKKVYSVIDADLTTGNATLTTKIGAVAVTNGVVTITQAGSAAGDMDVATPSAANTIAIGDVLSVTVGGLNDSTTPTAEVTFYIET